MAEELFLREVRARDRQGIANVIRGCANLTEEEKDCANELLDIYLGDPEQKDYSFIAAFLESGSPAGYACYGRKALTKGVYDLYWILVDPGQRGKGIGTRLLLRAEEIVRAEGARMMVAETSGLGDYEPARAFYIKNGFREEARIREFYKDHDDMIIYVKRF
ncbi:MAG: GNAT family N-acetyltransferase [Deltaproteobacteria bacterium]|nr:GNAT family N-acetyltransferase [Deltaproteobacteria bacterium]